MSAKPLKLKIGWAEVDTTPAGKVDLSGQYYHRIADGIHSRLVATALVFESEKGEQAVMVSLELVGFQSDFQDELRVRVRVEHIFGAQANDMGGTIVRTIGLARAKAKIGMKNLAYNMRRLGQLQRLNPCPA